MSNFVLFKTEQKQNQKPQETPNLKEQNKNTDLRKKKREEMVRFSTATMIFAAAMTAMVLVSLPEVEAQTATTCVNKLVPCFSALTTTTRPPKECCDSIKEAVKDELQCLCTVYNTPGLLSGFNVSTAQALNLSRRCDVTTDLSACSGTFFRSLRFFFLVID